jgi:ABC-2 type transport system ATP-binding protein
LTRDLAIEAVGLEKSYGSTPVLDGVDLELEPGTVLALLGPNGAGKTTTVRILATLAQPDAGRARVAGFDLVTQREQVRGQISLTGQSAAVDELQTAEENLRMAARLRGMSRRAAQLRAAELLERFDLAQAAGRRVATYSGGMRRRLDLAIGLVTQPAVMFLDEPTTGLDPRSRQTMWDVVGDLVAAGVAVFLTTQYLEEADRLADEVAVLDRGRVIARGTPTELKHRVADQRLVLELADSDALERACTTLAERALDADPAHRTLSLATDGSAVHVRSILDELERDDACITRFNVHAATLDDVFLALTRQETANV